MNKPYMREAFRKSSNQYGAKPTPPELRVNLRSIILMALKAYQSSLVFRAMNRKDVAFAKQAVKMMTIYMILTVIEQFWPLIVYPPNRDEFLALLIRLAVDIIFNLALFTSVYYFEASKVYKLLNEADKLKSAKAQ